MALSDQRVHPRGHLLGMPGGTWLRVVLTYFPFEFFTSATTTKEAGPGSKAPLANHAAGPGHLQSAAAMHLARGPLRTAEPALWRSTGAPVPAWLGMGGIAMISHTITFVNSTAILIAWAHKPELPLPESLLLGWLI